MRHIYNDVKEEDLALSGPHVWPYLLADEAVDRFIFKRPEIAYRLALKRADSNRAKKGSEPLKMMTIEIRRMWWNGGKQETKKAGRFGHMINRQDPLQDVKNLLEILRIQVKRSMPNRPLLNCSLQLKFKDTEENEHLLAWQEKWL